METYHLFVVSDATSETAYRMLKAALPQFKQDSLITRYANVRNESQIREILQFASPSHTLLVHTFVSSKLRNTAETMAKEEGIACVDLLGPLMKELSSFFHKRPVAKPGLLHQVDDEYFARIDAIEYAVGHDDSRSTKDINTADITIVGVSRTSKTPVSIYLAQDGWKVANIPIVVGVQLPEELFQLEQRKVVGFSIEPERLAEIRRVRLQHMGAADRSYADLDCIKEEIRYARSIFSQNPNWPVIDVTRKSIEETSREVLDRLLGMDRKR